MTLVADTRFLVVVKFPPSAKIARKALNLLRQSLAEGLYVPSIVITGYTHLIGGRHGLQYALTHIGDLMFRGARTATINRSVAEAAGKMLLRKRVPIAYALIAAVYVETKSTHVISDDPHFSEIGVAARWL